MNQILTQKWFLLQNIKDSSYFRNGVFNNKEWTISQFKLKQVGMQPEIHTSMHSRHLLTYGQSVKAFFDLNNCLYFVEKP
jgi:hypothetical protein